MHYRIYAGNNPQDWLFYCMHDTHTQKKKKSLQKNKIFSCPFALVLHASNSKYVHLCSICGRESAIIALFFSSFFFHRFFDCNKFCGKQPNQMHTQQIYTCINIEKCNLVLFQMYTMEYIVPK